MYPTIQIDFGVDSASPLDVITDLLGEEPKKTRTSVVFPEPIYYWGISTSNSHCTDLEEKFDEMISILGSRVEAFIQMSNDPEIRDRIAVCFNAIVVMEVDERPVLCLSKERIALLASMNAQFSITIYSP